MAEHLTAAHERFCAGSYMFDAAVNSHIRQLKMLIEAGRKLQQRLEVGVLLQCI